MSDAEAYWPAGQAPQPPAPSLELLPAGHVAQLADAALPEYLPATQVEQDADFALVEYLPSLQTRHEAAPLALA